MTLSEAKPDSDRDARQRRKRRAVVNALRSPSGEVIPHPALDVPVDETAHTGHKGLDFVLVMIGLSVALVKDLRQDPMMIRRRYAQEAVDDAVIAGVVEHGDDFVIAVEKDPDL
ncbi:hypothetical protein BH09ACT7_BH09ACT7_57710 [soil metagenome]